MQGADRSRNDEFSAGSASGYPVEVGRAILPTWPERVRAFVGAAAMVVLLGVLAAAAVGLVLALIAVIVSAAIN